MIGYLAIGEIGEEVDTVRRLRGGIHPTVFKTTRNAFRAAGPYGHVLIFDLSSLPQLKLEDCSQLDRESVQRSFLNPRSKAYVSPPRPEWPRVDRSLDARFEQFQIAERQMVIWAQRADRLRRELNL